LQLKRFYDQRVLLQSGVQLQKDGVGLGCVFAHLGVLEHVDVGVHARDSLQVELGGRDVHAQQAFLRVHAFVEVEHLYLVVLVHEERQLSVFFLQLHGHAETGADLDVVALNRAHQSSNHNLLVLGSPDVVVEDGWHDVGVHNSLQSFD